MQIQQKNINNKNYLITDNVFFNKTKNIFKHIEPFKGVARSGRDFNFVGALLPKYITENNKGSSEIGLRNTQIPNINVSDGSTVERYSWQNGNGCVSIEELKIINGDHDWPSPLSFWANQDIDASVEVWNFVSKFDMMGLIGCNSTNHFNIDIINPKTLIRRVDILGKESNEIKNQLLFYIYDDGTVEKKLLVK